MDGLENDLPKLKFTLCEGFKNNRQKMTKDAVRPKILMFGKIRNIPRGVICDARGSKLYPEIEIQLRDIASTLNFPTYTNMQINKNVDCKEHLDKGNVGMSTIFTLGKFTGGGLLVNGVVNDIYKKPLMFDGSKILHGTEDFTGDRYCIIYYSK